MRRKIDIDVAAATQILEALGCSTDPVFLGHGRTDGLTSESDGVTSLEAMAQSDLYGDDAYKTKIRFWSGSGLVRGTVYSMILDRLDAEPMCTRRKPCR